jgi:hypothetical protein
LLPLNSSLSAIGYQATGEIGIGDANRLHRRPAQSRTQLTRNRPTEHRNFLRVREPPDFVQRALPGIGSKHHALELSSLQSCPNPCHTDHDVSSTESEPQQTREL